MGLAGLKMIAIRGYAGDAEEAFQGIGPGESLSPGPGYPDSGPYIPPPAIGEPLPTTELPIAPEVTIDNAMDIDWGTLPETMRAQVTKYLSDLAAWTRSQDAQSRDLPAVIKPLVPVVIGTATGSLPAVAAGYAIQLGLHVVEGLAENWVRQQENAPLLEAFEKAFLKDKEDSILQKAADNIADLKYNDEVIDFGPFRIHLKGKIIEY
jgi:hypothetical protein